MGRREGRWGCGLLLPQSLLLLLLLLLCGHAHATLVAYYSFDNATVDSIPALSGYCPANVPVALAGPAFAAVNDSGMFNQGLCFLSSRGYMGTCLPTSLLVCSCSASMQG
ncbi:uncharacterized protein ACA1_195270 [Acanthamoeba castellanii str. Neff]|uniref:Uncharacterized protein n=1 Tax=Acanthamoeba castellanii (strain ATCC 30010 / Neff) TaxID=1257118 RepID=L8H5J7_ACACF|nr:uncharacterized protein ACA1_195270 [Acanthamoeba castellanii str. Neff]ELR20445.1 hypothetical protein ACA1_195270 [Acanthamoeba castellanii str. Neff]